MVKIVVSIGIFFALFILNGFVDIFEFLINIISLSVVGSALQVINFIFDFVVGIITAIFLYFLGGKFVSQRLIVQTIGQVAEFIPGLDILPIRTVALLINMALYFIKEGFEEEKSEGGLS